MRFAGGVSLGRQPQKFFLGGTSMWLNYDSKYGNLLVDDIDDVYFSTFEMPLRGGLYYQLVGNRFILSNLEFRFLPKNKQTHLKKKLITTVLL